MNKNAQKTKISSLQTFNTKEACPWLIAISQENRVAMTKYHDHNKQGLTNQQNVHHKHQLTIQPIQIQTWPCCPLGSWTNTLHSIGNITCKQNQMFVFFRNSWLV